jgi:hypothetical protein
MCVADLSPGELAVSIAIQSDGISEVAKGDVPLSLNAIILNRQREIAVAGFVSPSGKA